MANTKVVVQDAAGYARPAGAGDTLVDGNSLGVAYTDEQAQDAVGAMVDASLTYVDGTPLLQRAALTGDVTASAGSNTTAIANNAVTLAKMQDLTTDRLLGRDTTGTGDPEQLTVGGGIEFTGSGGIQTSALTGDVTKTAGGTATTIASDAVTYAKMQNVSAASRLLGRGSAAGAGDPEELTLGANLSLSGTTLSATGGSPTLSSASVAFTDGDTARRVTVTDAAVSGTSKILLGVVRPTTTAENDPGFAYTANVISRGAGTFDVNVVCTDWSGGDCTEGPPSETITLIYTVA